MKIYVKLVEIMHCLLRHSTGGKTDIPDEARRVRPHEAKDPYHIEKVKEVLDEDRSLT